MDEVVGIDTAAQHISMASGARFSYDYLVLATGATHSYFGHDEWEHLAPGLKSIEDALGSPPRAARLCTRRAPDAGEGWHRPLNFVVIGGGPTGVELVRRIQ